MILWEKHYNTGNFSVDYNRKKIVQIYNQIYKEDKTKTLTIYNYLLQLQEHIKTAFHIQEKHSECKVHKSHHKRIKKELQTMTENYLTNEICHTRLKEYIKSNVLDHILHFDIFDLHKENT